MKNLSFSSALLLACLFMLSLLFMSNDFNKYNQDTADVGDTTVCKEVVIIDNHIYMVVNGVQHPIVLLKNRRSFHNHFEYFYNLGLHPIITEYRIPEDTDVIILECLGKFYY